jgi:hypothetical protein
MTRPRALSLSLYAPLYALALVALALISVGSPLVVRVAIAASAWFALWIVVAALFEARITAWVHRCPRLTASRAQHDAMMAEYDADMARRRARDDAMPWIQEVR